MRKVIYTLNVNNYSKQITKITYPFIEDYAKKIGGEFQIISERKFPTAPITYEKIQLFELSQDNEWTLDIDSDVLVNPDLFDITDHLSKDTVLQYGNDLAGNRFKSDNYSIRDGRYIGSCNWFTVASNLCRDLWQPLDITFDEALSRITPVLPEITKGIKADHLIDDFVLTRNIARYGLKYTTCKELFRKLQPENIGNQNYLFHEYMLNEKEKEDYLTSTALALGLLPWYKVPASYVLKTGAF